MDPRPCQSSALIQPNALPGWNTTDVCRSTRSDNRHRVAELNVRCGRRVWLLDTSGLAPSDDWCERWQFSLLDLCGTFAEAVEVCTRIVRAAREPGVALNGTDATFESYAAELFAALTYAAECGRDLGLGTTTRDLKRWIDAAVAGISALDEPIQLLSSHPAADTVSAIAAIALVTDGRENNGDTLAKLRNSVANSLLAGEMLDRFVHADRHRSTDPADVIAAGDLVLVECNDDNPVRAGAQAALGDLVVDNLVAAQRQAWRAGATTQPLRVLYDEAASGHVNPSIPTWAATGAGDGIAVMLCAQSLHQLERVFPVEGAGLADTFTHRLFLRGHAIDGERVASMFGTYDAPRVDRTDSHSWYSPTGTSLSHTVEQRPRVTPHQLVTLPQWHGLLASAHYTGPLTIEPLHHRP